MRIFPLFFIVWVLSFLLGLPICSGKEVPPANSEMAKSGLAPVTVGALSSGAGKSSSTGYHMQSVTANPFDAKELPPGVEDGVKLVGVAQTGGGKGDYTIKAKLDPSFKMLGAWFYISPDSPVQRIGIQIQEIGGEYFLLTFPGSFTGWQWLEGKRGDFVPMSKQKRENSEDDGVLDQAIARLSIIWDAKDQNPTEVGVAGLSATLE